MLTKNRLARVRTIVLTVVAASSLVGMTLQPALAKTPDVARPAIAAVADMDLSAMIAQFRALILNLQARIDELEAALNAAPPVVEETPEVDEAPEVDETPDVDNVEEQVEDVDDGEVDEDVGENDDHKDAPENDDHDNKSEHENDGEEDGDN
ncbi:MAG: hypothetical protein M3R57_06180 [Chloroflexota bacterium]|nr:hypothetical protein [Chloroflexota bacterium]